jgi:hypothetical protein
MPASPYLMLLALLRQAARFFLLFSLLQRASALVRGTQTLAFFPFSFLHLASLPLSRSFARQAFSLLPVRPWQGFSWGGGEGGGQLAVVEALVGHWSWVSSPKPSESASGSTSALRAISLRGIANGARPLSVNAGTKRTSWAVGLFAKET